MRRLIPLLVLAWMTTTGAGRPAAAGGAAEIDALEQRVVREPENLRVAADYRQLIIAEHAYDRAIALFERLAKRPGAGANAFMNLAFSYVDKVPVSGSIRQAYLGRDAIGALTRSIAIAPTDIAYFVRGLVNLYYNKLIFHRTDKGVADLERARQLASLRHDPPYMPRILQTLGDGYFRLDQPGRARQVWREGLGLAPASEALRHRLSATDDELRGIIAAALDADVRVDTSLHELDGVLPAASGWASR
jgi:tetratricopeptide (TPR) repeat protein